jgi:stress response protein YsnF
MKQTVIGFFDSSTEAQRAVEKLAEKGFTIDQVDITYNERSVLENQGTDYSSTSSATSTGYSSSTDSSVTDRSRDNDGFGEKVSRFFKSLFDDDDERTKYERAAQNAAIVTVLTDSYEKAQLASEILDDCGAVDVDERSSQYGSEYSSSQSSTTSSYDRTDSSDDDDTTRSTSRRNVADITDYDETSERSSRTNISDTDDAINTGRSIPIVEENLQVGKREVERGAVRVRSRIIERPVEETVRLREERVRVERNPVNRPATEGDLNTFREGEMEIKQRAEVPVVNKEARVVEEVNLNRDVTEREEVIRDTVRRTEVEIDETDVDSDDLRTSRTKRSDKLD